MSSRAALCSVHGKSSERKREPLMVSSNEMYSFKTSIIMTVNEAGVAGGV